MSSEDHVSIEGTILMLDDKTPHVAVPVQAIRDGEVIATTLSDESGRYQFTNLEPGQYQLRCQVLGGYAYYRATEHALCLASYDSGADDSGDILDVQRGKTLRNTDFRFAPFKKGTWRHYTRSDGVIEATDEAGEMYETERLLEVLQEASPALSAQEMLELIVSDVTAYVGDEEASDDITIVTIRCKQ
jgi:hypothetical protein